MPLLWLRPLLSMLPRKKDTYYLLAIAVLLVLLWIAWLRIKKTEAELAAKPRIETKVEARIITRVVTKTIEGPVRIEYRTIEKPGGEKIIERIVERESREMTRSADADKDIESVHSEVPIMSEASRRWIVGYGFDPLAPRDLGALRAGVTLFRWLDVSYGHELRGKFSDGHRLDLGWRF